MPCRIASKQANPVLEKRKIISRKAENTTTEKKALEENPKRLRHNENTPGLREETGTKGEGRMPQIEHLQALDDESLTTLAQGSLHGDLRERARAREMAKT
jgi:hypothetical protein